MSQQLTAAISLGMNRVILQEDIEFAEAMYEDAGYLIGSSEDNELIEFFCDYSDYLTGHAIIENINEANIVVETGQSIINELVDYGKAGKEYSKKAGQVLYQARRDLSKGLQDPNRLRGKLGAVLRAPMRVGGALRRGIMKGLGKKRGQQFADWRMDKAKKTMKKAGKAMVSSTKAASGATAKMGNAIDKSGVMNRIRTTLHSAKGAYHVNRTAAKGLKAAGAKNRYDDWKKAKAGKPTIAKK